MSSGESAYPVGLMPYHVGLITRNIDEGMAALSDLFGLSWRPVKSGAEPGLSTPSGPVDWVADVTFALESPVGVELLAGSPGSPWETERLAVFHHLAFWSDDVGADVSRFEADGWGLEMTFYDDEGRPSSVAYLRKQGQPRIELVGTSRRTE